MKAIKFFLVALMTTAMMFSACNKDDDKNEEPSSSNEIIVGEIGMPKNNELIENDSFTATWAASKSNKSDATFQYEVFLSDDGGASWNSLGKYKTNNCQLNELEGDKLYQLKVKTYCTDASGNETTAESEPVSFVAYYKKGTIGASAFTENSITMEWGNLLPYDEVELTISECSLYDGANYSYKNEQSPIIVKEGNTYTFTNLKSEQGYAIQYKCIGKDNAFVLKGTYYVLTVDCDKYLTDGQFNKYELLEINGRKWALNSNKSVVNCWGLRFFRTQSLAYGYVTAFDSDMIDFLKFVGFTDSDIENHTQNQVLEFNYDVKSEKLAGYYSKGFGVTSLAFWNRDDNAEYYYYLSGLGYFMREGPKPQLPAGVLEDSNYIYIKL
jgi:hypothetical protein